MGLSLVTAVGLRISSLCKRNPQRNSEEYPFPNSWKLDPRVSKFDETLGWVSIFQDPSKEKGEWQRAMIVIWIQHYHGYYRAVFDGGVDYIPQRLATAQEVHDEFKQNESHGNFMTKYSSEQVKQYGREYGIPASVLQRI